MSDVQGPIVLDLSDEGTISTTAPGYILFAIVVIALIGFCVLFWYLQPLVNNDREYRAWAKSEGSLQVIEDGLLDLQQNNAMLRNWHWWRSKRAKDLREDGLEYCEGYHWLPEDVGKHGKTAHIACVLFRAATKPVGTLQ